jgi:hypothetical protein
MASSLPTSCYQSENDLKALRKAIGWQFLGYDSKMRHGMLSLAQPGDFLSFLACALVGLVPPFSSFFLVLLEHYGLQLQHLSPQSIMMVAIFTHFYEMFMGVRPSMHQFRRFHVLRPVNRQPPYLGGYYFHADWVPVQADTHDRLTLPTAVPTESRTPAWSLLTTP